MCYRELEGSVRDAGKGSTVASDEQWHWREKMVLVSTISWN
jgi:hypothetical protein